MFSAFFIIILAGLGACFYKIRKIHLAQFQIIEDLSGLDNVYHQLESLINLRSELKWDDSLPQLRGWAASPDLLLLLALSVRENQPVTIVECSSGSSTLVLARVLQLIENGGHVYSLEHDKQYALETERKLIKYELQNYATIIHSPLEEINISG